MQTDYSYELPPILDSISDTEYERLIDHHTGVNRNQTPDIPLRLYLLHSFWGVGRNELRKTLNSHGNSQKVFLFSSLSNLQRVYNKHRNPSTKHRRTAVVRGEEDFL